LKELYPEPSPGGVGTGLAEIEGEYAHDATMRASVSETDTTVVLVSRFMPSRNVAWDIA
jgi:hypothetical protein